MFRCRRLAAVALVFATLPVAAVAQNNGPFSGGRLGDGELEHGPQTDPLVEAWVELAPGGNAVIVVRTRRESFEYRGTWKPGEREQRLLDITGAPGGDSANAEGWVMTRHEKLTRIEIIGRTSGGKKLRLSFQGTADLPVPAGIPLDSTRDGEGTLDNGRAQLGIRSARVRLDAAGGAEVSLQAPDTQVLRGRWSDLGGGRLRFDADSGFGDLPGSGSGTIELRDGRLSTLTVSGTSGRITYRIDFRAVDRPAPPVVGGPVPRSGRIEMTEDPGFDRRGGDYTNVYFDTLLECKLACRRDDRCVAYSYNTRARMCYLKDRVTAPERRSDTVSGVKTGGG